MKHGLFHKVLSLKDIPPDALFSSVLAFNAATESEKQLLEEERYLG